MFDQSLIDQLRAYCTEFEDLSAALMSRVRQLVKIRNVIESDPNHAYRDLLLMLYEQLEDVSVVIARLDREVMAYQLIIDKFSNSEQDELKELATSIRDAMTLEITQFEDMIKPQPEVPQNFWTKIRKKLWRTK